MPLLKFTVQGVVLEVEPMLLTKPVVAALENGRYERPESAALKKLLRPDDVYFELGGGIGFMSTLAWRIVGDESRIHVYEANPALLKVIKRTWAANAVKGNIYHCMLGTGLREEREFHVARAFWASSGDVDYGNGTTITVPQRDFLQQLDKKAATFLMMDIEGGERDLLDKVLSPLVRTVVAEYHPQIIGAEMVASLWRHLEDQGFRLAEHASEGNVKAYVR
jgi:FkbM family methyltransferase